MAGKQCVIGLVVLTMASLSGCARWCQRYCQPPQQVYQQPVCCPPPVCCQPAPVCCPMASAPACCPTSGPMPAAPPQQWQRSYNSTAIPVDNTCCE